MNTAACNDPIKKSLNTIQKNLDLNSDITFDDVLSPTQKILQQKQCPSK